MQSDQDGEGPPSSPPGARKSSALSRASAASSVDDEVTRHLAELQSVKPEKNDGPRFQPKVEQIGFRTTINVGDSTTKPTQLDQSHETESYTDSFNSSKSSLFSKKDESTKHSEKVEDTTRSENVIESHRDFLPYTSGDFQNTETTTVVGVVEPQLKQRSPVLDTKKTESRYSFELQEQKRSPDIGTKEYGSVQERTGVPPKATYSKPPSKKPSGSDASVLLKPGKNRVHNSDENIRQYSFQGDAMERSEEGIGPCGYVLMFFSGCLVVLFFPFSLCVAIKIVQEYERAVIFRLGRIVSNEAKGPGMFFMWPCIDDMRKVDMRTLAQDIPPQEILTRDSVTVTVDAVLYMRVFNANASICNVENAFQSTRLLSATTLRNMLGLKNMTELLSGREQMAQHMQVILDAATDKWGIKVERVEIKDVRLPRQLQRAMAAEAEASREARAKVVAAEGEHKASRALKEAADIIAQSPSALQLRYLQTLNIIAAERESTIIFPLPMNIMPQNINT